MLDKYKVTIWNTLCFLSIGICLILISPYLLHKEKSVKEEIADIPPLKEKNSIRKVWKRGKHESITTIIENSSSSDLNEGKSHSADDWVSITWSKKNDS